MVGKRRATEAKAIWNNPLRACIRYASEHGGVFNWDGGLWTDGIDPSDVPEPEPRDQAGIIEPPDGQSSNPRRTSTTSNGSEQNSVDNQFDTHSVDPLLRSRVKDIVQLVPISNGEIPDAWGLTTGKEAWQYLTSELDDYYERNADQKSQPTDKAHDLVSATRIC